MTRPDEPAPLSEADDLQLNAYVDGELAPEVCADFERRLATEPQLRASCARLEALRRVIGGTAAKSTPSDAFRARIAGIGLATETVRRVREPRGFDWRMLAATAVIAAGAGSFATQILMSRPSGFVAGQAIVAIHQHALLAVDPVEVASSDRHTVRPWFDANLALSPPVADLAGDGFPLAGGRIDVIDGRRVPVLIYRRRSHLVSVVAVPLAGSRDTGAAVSRTTRDGYIVLTWHGPDFKFAAIADIADGELAGFVEKLRLTMKAS